MAPLRTIFALLLLVILPSVRSAVLADCYQTFESVFAGSGSAGAADGAGAAASFSCPAGLTYNPSTGNLFVGQCGDVLRVITPAGVVSTSSVTVGYVAAFDGANNMIYANGYQILNRSVATGTSKVIAGSGSLGSVDGQGTMASFFYPDYLTLTGDNTILVSEYGASKIKSISPAGLVKTLAGSVFGFADGVGSNAKFKSPYGIAWFAQQQIALVADQNGHRVRAVNLFGSVQTLAGNGASANIDGTGSSASIEQPRVIAIDNAGAAAYITTVYGAVRRFTFSSSILVTIYQYAIASNNLEGIAFNLAGTMFVARRASVYISAITCVPCPVSYYCSTGAPVICPIGSYCPLASLDPIPCPCGGCTLAGSSVAPSCTPSPSQSLSPTPSSTPYKGIAGMQCLPGSALSPNVTTISFARRSNNLVHAFSAVTGMLYVAHAWKTAPLFGVSTNSSLFNVTTNVTVVTANNGLQNLCVRADGGVVALAFDNQAGAANYMAFSGGATLAWRASSLGGGQGTVGMTCDTASIPLKSYLQFWSSSQPIGAYNEAGTATGPSTPSLTSYSSAYYIHAPYSGSSLFVIAGGATALSRVNAATMVVDIASVPFQETWLGAKLVWNLYASQLVMGARNLTCSLVIGFNPATLVAVGPAACVAPTGSLASELPAIDKYGNFFFLTLMGSLLQFSFMPTLGTVKLSASPLFPLSNVSVGFSISGTGLSGRMPGGLIYFPNAELQSPSTPAKAPVVFVATLDTSGAIAARVDLVCSKCRAGTYATLAGSTSCTLCPAGSFCSFASVNATVCPLGTYSTASGADSCTPCPLNATTTSTNSTSVNSCVCAAGFFGRNPTCLLCPRGHYCPINTTDGMRFNCGRGNYCPLGSGAPVRCPLAVSPAGGWPAGIQGPAFMSETAQCLNQCFFNVAVDGSISSNC